MVGVILTLVAIGLVSYFVIKNYYPPIILCFWACCSFSVLIWKEFPQLLPKLPQTSSLLTLLRHLQIS